MLPPMAVSAKRAQSLALSLENASSYPHFHRLAFRTPRRTFATLDVTGTDLNLKLDLEQQRYFCELRPQAISAVPGGWGRMGWTRCELASLDLPTFTQALKAAHASANEPPPKRKAAKKRPA
jgi:hypothetical protein